MIIMKKLLIALTFITLFYGCSAIDELTKFDIDYNSNVTVPANTAVNLPFMVGTPPVETSSESKFESNETRKDLIEEIKLKRMRLTITAPEREDFSFLESIEIYMKAEGVEEIQIASLKPVPNDAGIQIELDTSDADLKEYIKKDSFSLRVNTTTDEVIDNDIDIAILSVFAVDASIFGV